MMRTGSLLSLIAIVCTLFAAGPLWAVPVTIDTVTTSVGDSASFTFSHPIDAAGRLLLVAVHYIDDNDSSESVTFDALPLTLVGAITNPSKKPRIELWQLLDPPIDTADVHVTVANSHSANVAVSAVSLIGVDPTTPLDTCITKTAKTTSGSIVISSEQADLVMGAVTSLANGEPSPSIGSTKIWSTEITSGLYGQGTTRLGANSVNIGWAFDENKEWSALAVAIVHMNMPPVLSLISAQTIEEGDTLHLEISAADEDGTIPSLTAKNLPADAKFKDNGNGTGLLSFIADQHSEGVYTLLFIAGDGLLADSQFVTLTVNAANVPPVLGAIGPQSVALGDTLSLTISATDADSTTPTLLVSPAVANAILTDHADGTASYVFIPNVAQIGTNTVTFIATDGALADSELVEIAVVDTTTLAYIRVETEDGSAIGDTSLTADDSLTLFCRGYKSDDSPLGNVAAIWSLIGSDSILNCPTAPQASAVLYLRRPGTDRIVVSYSTTFADTTGLVTCTPGLPDRLVVSPDNRDIVLGDTIQFSALAYDADSNLTSAGQLTWSVLGNTGAIDPLGLFISAYPGMNRVGVSTDLSDAIDTTGLIIVQAVLVTPLALGTTTVNPNDRNSVLLAFSIGNYYQTPKTVTSLTVRNCSRGAGTFSQVAGNIDSFSLYVERDESWYDVSAWDTAIARSAWGQDSTFTSPCSLVVAPGSEEFILVAADISKYSHDGDSIDFKLIPTTDIEILDLTTVNGPDTANSYGARIIDGMTAAQIAVGAGGNRAVESADTLYLCGTFDLPRNGYAADTLNALEIVNSGTASIGDIDSLLLFADDSDGAWEGRTGEVPLGALTFTGGSWSRSGLSLPLTDTTTRLYVAARLTQFPGDRATIAVGIPMNGVRVTSGNDGPLDWPVYSPDTLTIHGREAIALTTVELPARTCVPGKRTGPLLAVELTNGYALAVALESLALAFTGIDPQGATPIQLAGQIDSVYLYVNKDNAIATISTEDSLVAVGSLSSGSVVFPTNELSIAGVGGTRTLVVEAKLSLLASKNGNTVAFSIADSSAIVCDRAVRLTGSLPVANAAAFTIDAFPAAAVTTQTLPATSLYAGQNDRPVFAFDLPRNGYASDKLAQIDLTNRGSLSSPNLLKNVRLWMDLTANGLTADDQLLGELRIVGNLWRLGNLRAALNLPMTRFLVTVSIAEEQFDGGTLQFRIPVSGIQYASGTVGPDDANVTAPNSFLVFPSNRVTAISIPGTPGSITPGSTNNLLMSFALYNGYVGQNRTLSRITLTNTSHTVGTTAFADHELGQVSVYWDVDKNRIPDSDSLIGTGLFSQGTMRLDGISTALAPESLAYFFVVANVPSDLNDNDSLSVAIATATDFAFQESAVLNGDLPLTNGSRLAINGSVRRQYRTLGPNGRSLAPGDTGITFMAFSPAANGSQVDMLQGITVRNLGTADTASVSDLKLWHDLDAGGTLSAGDTVIASLDYSSDTWSATNLAMPVLPTPPVLLICGKVTAGAQANATLRLEIPVSGCQFASDNDGPLDSALVAPGMFTISTSALRVAFSSMRYTYSVGQTIDLAMSATNVSAVTIGSVSAELVNIINPARVRLDSSVTGPVTLAAGGSFTDHYYFTAVGVGGVAVRLRARSGSPSDSSVIIQTPTIYVQQAISPVSLRTVSTGPTAVTRGQTNVFPLTLECAHPNTSSAVAEMSLASLRLRVTDGRDTSIAANTVFSRMTIATGFEILSVIQNVPADSVIVLPFAEPLVIPPGSSQSIMLITDIASDASASHFTIQIDSASWIPLLDVNTDQRVQHASSMVYPIKTVSTRIDSPSHQIAVSAISCTHTTVNYGQTDADIMKLSLRHTGLSGSSAVQLTGVSLRVEDSMGVALPAADLFTRISLHRRAYFIGEAVPVTGVTSPVEVHLSTPVTLNAQEIDSIFVAVSIEPTPGHSGFRLVISDSSGLVVRDLNTGAALMAVTDTSLVTGSAFPIRSNWTSFRMPAEPICICPVDNSSGSVAGGADSVSMISLSVKYPVSTLYSAVILKQVRLRIVDGTANPIEVDQLFSRIGYRAGTGSLQYGGHVSAGSGFVDVPFGDSGVVVAPGDSLVVRIAGDLHLEATATEFALQLSDVQKVTAIDMSDRRHYPGVAQDLSCSATYPFSTAPTSILLPAGRPFASHRNLPVQMAAAGSQRVVLFDGAIDYASTSPLGRIELHTMTIALARRAKDGVVPRPVNQSVDAVYLEVNGVEIGSDTLLARDTITISAGSPVTINRGDNLPIRLTCDLSSSALPGNITAMLIDSAFLGVVDKSLLTPVYPIFSGQTYPFKAGELSVVAASLETSFSNYPNPFNPSQGDVTTIGFVLTENATVDIDIFTLTGESVCRVTRQSHRSAGAHQTDTWAGMNGDGRAVQPGTYYCRITATYDSGRVDTFRRKIAVVR